MGFNSAASIFLFAAFPAALLATQPVAPGKTAIPEPTDLALFAMGVTGLLIGRRAAMRRKDDEGED